MGTRCGDRMPSSYNQRPTIGRQENGPAIRHTISALASIRYTPAHSWPFGRHRLLGPDMERSCSSQSGPTRQVSCLGRTAHLWRI